MSNSSTEREPLEILADEFIASHRRGENPNWEEYAERFPQWKDRIRELFPMLLLLENHRHEPPARPLPAAPPTMPERLGEYRIIREIGRGGMGIVYEATQETLDRQVALKVLPLHATTDPSYLSRFQQEARTAARLHHTNIVPVHGVGEQHGVHYFAMQYIEGRPLDVLIKEMKHLHAFPGSQPGHHVNDTPLDHTEELSQSLARWLLQGQIPKDLDSDTKRIPLDHEVMPGTPEPSRIKGHGVLTEQRAKFSSAVTSSLSTIYQRQIAHVGMQLADALAYAHAQGVIHRDIKPSNILMDRHGTAWIMDFGLAKSPSGQNLTQIGMIVGTLRYMAPERFQKEADASSDLYGLGATLYELLAFRPAFEESRQDRLMQQILTSEPPSLRRLHPAIHKDLATIIHKAMAKDASRRYASADLMRDDLRRFLEGRPILARSMGLVERTWLWSRRNPLPAALAALLLITLTSGLCGMTALWWQADTLRDEADQNLFQARNEFARAEQHRLDAQKQRDEAEHQRDQAENHLLLALNTVHQFYTVVSEHSLKDAPALRPFRKQLLGMAMNFYDSFGKKLADNPRLQRLSARAKLHLGELQLQTGPLDQALKNLTEAVSMLERLHGSQPSLDQRLELADALMMLSQIKVLLPYDEQHSVLARCRQHLEFVHAARPADASIRNMLADVLMLDYACRKGNGETDPSLLDQVNELLASLIHAESPRQRFPLELVISHSDLAGYLIEINRGEDADVVLKRANEYLATIPRSEHNGMLLDRARNRLQLNQAKKYLRQNEIEKGHALLQQLVVQLQRMLEYSKAPENLDLSNMLADVLYYKAAAEKLMKQPAEAMQSYIAAAKMYEMLIANPLVPAALHERFQIALNQLGMLYFDAKEFEHALKSFQMAKAQRETLFKLMPDDADHLMFIAGEWNNIGNAHRELNQLNEATLAYSEAVRIQRQALSKRLRHPDQARDWLFKHYRNLTQTQCDLGQVEAALMTLAAMKEAVNPASRDMVLFARVCMRCLPAIESHGGQHRERLTEQAKDLAVQSLKAAVQYGLQQRATLESPVFAPLKDRKDYQDLIQSIVKRSSQD